MMDLAKTFTETSYDLADIERLYLMLKAVIAECAGKPINNDLIYNQLIFTGIDGVVLRLMNFTDEIYKLLNQIKANHLDAFANKKIEEHLGTLKDDYLIQHNRKILEAAYQKWFPLVAFEKRQKPNFTDFDLIRLKIGQVIEPVKAHRDSVVAHKDKNPKFAKEKDVEAAFAFLKELLSELSLLNHFVCQNFEIGGIAANPSRTAQEVAELALFNKFQRDERRKQNEK